MSNIRELLEERERNTLSPFAFLSENASREREEQKCDLRTEFQRDRDRIIHSKSFRRLKGKTQVFLAPDGDHYRTRLTHTIEVSQIARTIARSLFLNEDLVEAASLGHDLGHTPFGHAGERALNEVCSEGFIHAQQSVRILRVVEKSGCGLNLTEETIDAVACHTGGTPSRTLEGRILRIADMLAYINHDVDDAIRGGVINNDDIPYEIRAVLGPDSSTRIDTMVRGVINASTRKNDIYMDEDILAATERLRDFLFDNVYIDSAAKTQEEKAENLVKELYAFFMKYPNRMPDEYQIIAEREYTERAVIDYVSGMTDIYALNLYRSLKLPSRWEL